MDTGSPQELFTLLFSIMFGVMLQSLSGLMPFPLGRIFGGYVEQEGVNNQKEINAQNRMRNEYNKRIETPSEEIWMIHVWKCRFFLSFILLNFIPILYYATIISIFNLIKFNTNSFIDYAGIFFLSLNIFTFYRAYIILTIWRKTKYIFCDLDLEERRISHNISSHLKSIFIFYILPSALYLLCIIGR